MCTVCDTYLGVRTGVKPTTTPSTPHEQLDQIAPRVYQEMLVAEAAKLDGVYLGPSVISVPGTRAFLVDQHRPGIGPRHAFMFPGEFAHIHPPRDGSLHMNLPEPVFAKALQNGWGEVHPAAGQFGTPRTIALIYGPRDDSEFKTVWSLVRISHAFAIGASG